jgi:hypothetical protein
LNLANAEYEGDRCPLDRNRHIRKQNRAQGVKMALAVLSVTACESGQSRASSIDGSNSFGKSHSSSSYYG